MLFARIPKTLRTASFGLAVLYAALFAASTLILGALAYWSVERSLDQEITNNIDSEVNLLEREFKAEGLREIVEQVQYRGTYNSSLDYLVLDRSGRRLAGELPRMPTNPGWTEMEVPRSGAQSEKFRVRAVTLDDGTRFAVGDDLSTLTEVRHAFLKALDWTVLAFLALAVFGGMFLSRAFMGRVKAITRTAEAIIDGELTSRVPLRNTDDTFDRLSMTLNRMLDRIQSLMEGLGQTSNDIAHALRTPLGNLRHKLENVKGRTPKDDAMISAAISDTDTTLETFSALLRIAQIEAGVRQSGFREVDLTELFGRVKDAFCDLAEDQGKTLVAEIEPSINTWGDRELLAEMVANLVDNALRHTSEGASIKVSLMKENSRVVARVADDGPGIPDEDRPRIFDRFYRLRRSINTPGTGLGLSLVAAVAELHGIKLTVATNAPGVQMIMTFVPNTHTQ